MSASFGILRVAPFAGFVQRFDDLIGSATTMSLYFIHSRRWRENHDAAIKAFVARAGTTLEVFLPDLENHELMYSLGKHFEDGPLIPALVGDAYRYLARLGAVVRRARDHLELLEQLRALSARREVHPAPDHQRAPRHPPEAVRR